MSQKLLRPREWAKKCAKFRTIILKRLRRRIILPVPFTNWKRYKKNTGF